MSDDCEKKINWKELVLTLLSNPKSTSVDGTNVTEQSIDDLIKAKQLLQGDAASSNPFGCIGRSKVIPPDAIGR